MINHSLKKGLSFLKLFERFIRDSRRGRRLLPNGEKISKGTIENYKYTLLVVRKFCICKGYYLRIFQVHKLSPRELVQERKYWKHFYKHFNDFMYRDLGYFDNYAGSHIKNIRTFFNYLNMELGLSAGDFHKLFYVRKQEIMIFPLTAEQLNFLIHNKEFENSLSKRMQEVKDFFVFGCTVALRFSDLKSLKRDNVKWLNQNHYLVVRSRKTSRESVIKMPGYAINIINKYSRRKFLLPGFNIVNLNKYIKQLLEKAGYIQPVAYARDRKGKAIELRKPLTCAKYNRFCDVATTHTMRRTAITTMLTLGIPEQVVRKISGHAPGSKEFYRYVVWAQTYQDREVDKMFAELEERKTFKAPAHT
jgi:integrase